MVVKEWAKVEAEGEWKTCKFNALYLGAWETCVAFCNVFLAHMSFIENDVA